MTDTVKDRILYIITHYNLSVKKFAEVLGMPQTTVNGYVTGTREPKMDFVIAIINRFENISAEWLMRGNGEMLKSIPAISSSNQGDGNNIEYNNVGIGNNVNASLSDSKNLKEISPTGKIEMSADPIDLTTSDSEMALLKAEIAHLKENIEIKDELIISLKETIALLKNKQN